jgi:cytochrome oxidase Cu insertion factor (SCO1/SenC/PrrC family)
VSSAAPRSAHDRRQRRQLIGLALMFFAPLALSFYLYYGSGAWHPTARVNAGVLVQPPRPLPPLTLPLAGGGTTNRQFLQGKWTFLYVQAGRCDADCLKHLYDTRQIRLALNRDMGRVQRVFIGASDCCDLPALQAAHPDLITVRADPADAPLLALLPGAADEPASRRVYLIDPLGNLMMFYAPDAKPKGMLQDMQRLLRLSQIG